MPITFFNPLLLFTAFIPSDGNFDMQMQQNRVITPEPDALLNIAGLMMFFAVALSYMV
jgi:hypothetical protein